MMKTNLISCDKHLDTLENCRQAFVKSKMVLPEKTWGVSCVYNEKNEAIHFLGGNTDPKKHISMKIKHILGANDYKEWKWRKKCGQTVAIERIVGFWIRKCGIGVHRVEKALVQLIALLCD